MDWIGLMRRRLDGARHVPRPEGAAATRPSVACANRTQGRATLTQGIPRLVGTLCLAWFTSAQACTGSAPTLESLSADMWWVPAARGDADAANRGRVSNLLVVRDGARLWWIGSGPSPAFARELACAVHERLGLAVTDVVSPWARPELVLGAAGTPRARHWAHVDVARAMRRQCAGCVQRLRQRLGAAAADLGRSPVRMPEHRLRGAQGRLGPFDWWRLERAPGSAVTVWLHRDSGVITAHGLLWTGDAPDLRDSELGAMREGTQRLQRIVAAAANGGRAPTLLGEQGPPAAPEEIGVHLAYWDALEAAIDAAMAAGSDGIVPMPLQGPAAQRSHGAAHALNWQRAWRHREQRALDAQPRGAVQRNLR